MWRSGFVPAQDTANERDSGDSDARPAEPVAVLMVKGRGAVLAGSEQGDLGDQEARTIDCAVFVVEDVA